MFDYAAGVFYMFGYHPFYRFQSKYLEVQYKVSASTAAYINGSLTLAFLSSGLLLAGVTISLLKPSARKIAMWNIVTSLVSVTGILVYTMSGCNVASSLDLVVRSSTGSTCNAACDCGLVEYSPVCGSDNVTYLSPCHAGCSKEVSQEGGAKTYQNCACIDQLTAVPGHCPVDCSTPLTIFIIILCLNKFIAGTEATANFMLGIRCIDEQDKVLCLSLYEVLLGVFAFIPSPILFGHIIDKSCVLWGGSHGTDGNCWLYDEDQLKYTLNFTAAGFIIVGTFLDVGTWYHSKEVKIFDEDEEAKCEAELEAL
jgi:solute carrier organic anion transporter family, member 5A